MKPTTCPTPIKKRAFFNPKINKLLPIACKRWTCPVCGPPKAYKLGQLAALAEPQRFVTLTAAANDVRTAYERLRKLSRRLRRLGYRWEYLAVPERHENGSYHLHLLQKGDYIPQRKLSELAEVSGMGRVVWIEAIKGQGHALNAAPKYLVKYMTKDPEKHPPNINRYAQTRDFWIQDGTASGRKAFEELHWDSSSKSDWQAVALGSTEIRGDDGSLLWYGSRPSG